MTSQAIVRDFELNSASLARGWRAGALVVDLDLRALHVDGRRVPIQEKPLRLLARILDRGGRPVARREIHAELWPHYDWPSFERSLNTAIRKLRRAIGDDAREPRLLETLRANGYRWIGPRPQALDSAAEVEAAIAACSGEAARVSGVAEHSQLASPPSSESSRWSAMFRVGATRTRAFALLGAIALVVAAAASTAIGRLATSPLRVEARVTAGSSADADRAAAEFRDTLLAGLGALPTQPAGAAPIVVRLDVDRGRAMAAEIGGAGGPMRIALDGNAEGREEVLVELAARLQRPSQAPARLPHELAASFAEAGTLLSTPPFERARIERAHDALERVLARVPDHVGVLRAFARSERLLALVGTPAPSRAEAERRGAVVRSTLRRALRVDPSSAAAAAELGSYLHWDAWDNEASARWYARALRLAPADGAVLHSVAWFDLTTFRIDDGLAHMNAAIAASPLDPTLHADLGWFYFRTGRYDDALRQCRSASQMPNADPSARECEFRALERLGRFDEAWAALRATPPAWLDATTVAKLSAETPETAYRAALHVAATWTREHSGPGFRSACFEAIAGERAAALADLRVAWRDRDSGLRLAGVTPELIDLLGADRVRLLALAERGEAIALD